MAKQPKKWMQGVAKTMHKGALHRALRVPEGKKIPAAKMAQARHSKNPHVRKMAGLAKAFAGAHHNHGGHAYHPPARG